MVWKDESTVRAIITVVINIPVLRRMLLKIGMIRLDFCHFMTLVTAIRRPRQYDNGSYEGKDDEQNSVLTERRSVCAG